MPVYPASRLPEVPNIDFDQVLFGGQKINLQDLELTSKIDMENEDVHPNELENPLDSNYDFARNAKILPHTTAFDTLAQSMKSVAPKGLIKKQVIKPGIGQPIKEGTMILYHYQYFYEGEEAPFDSTMLRTKPEKLIVRPGYALEGIFHALLTMKVQEASRFLINYQWAHGETGHPPRIKPRADILAEIELLKILDVLAPGDLTGDVVLSRTTVAQTLEEAGKLMDIGKALFAKKSVPNSKKAFRDCIRLIDSQPCYSDDEQKDLQEMKRRALSNLAGVYSKMNQHEHVCVLCEDALYIDPEHRKTMLLYVRALTRLTNFNKSASILKKAMKLFPNDPEFVKELQRLNTKKKEHALLMEEALTPKIVQLKIANPNFRVPL